MPATIDLTASENPMQRTLTIEYGDDLLLQLGQSAEQFSREARFLLAAKLFELGRIPSGQGARLCGKDRVDFLISLQAIGVPVANLRPEDAEDESRFAERG